MKWCPRLSKPTHLRQSEKAAFGIYSLTSGITTHFQPKLFLLYGAANNKSVSQGSFTELVEALQPLSCSPQGCTSLKIPLHLLFPHGETNPLEQFFFFFFWLHMQTCTVGQQRRLHGRPGAAAKRSVFSLTWCSWAAQGLSFALWASHCAAF